MLFFPPVLQPPQNLLMEKFQPAFTHKDQFKAAWALGDDEDIGPRGYGGSFLSSLGIITRPRLSILALEAIYLPKD